MSSTSIEHLRLVGELAEYCAENNLTIYKHEYDYLIFGSWIIVVGEAHHRIKFSWDGKESYLGVSESEFKNQNSNSDWQRFEWGPGGTMEQGAVFEFIREHLQSRYAS